MGKWATILKLGGKAINNPVSRNVGRSVGNAVIHPQQTLKGFGTAAKSAVVGGGLGYVAWENIAHDKPVIRTAADILVGEETVDKGLEMVGATADTIGSTVSKAGEALSEVKDTVSATQGTLGGISDFIKNISGGNGGEMFGNLLKNLGQGNVSGLSIAGLLLSGLLVFGRFGFMGKIAGAVLAMMLIGNNSRNMQTVPGGSSSPDQEKNEAVRQGGMRR